MWHAVGTAVSKRWSFPALQILRSIASDESHSLYPDERANLRLRTRSLPDLFALDEQHLCRPQRAADFATPRLLEGCRQELDESQVRRLTWPQQLPRALLTLFRRFFDGDVYT
jgi:hypothetical protein